MPLLRDGTTIGVITVTRTEFGTYADHHVQLLQTFADQAVIAIENVRLFDEVQSHTRDLSESLQQQTATADVLKVISRSPGELQPVFHAMLENATRICEAKFGTLYLSEDDGFRAAAMHNAPPAYEEARAEVVTSTPRYKPLACGEDKAGGPDRRRDLERGYYRARSISCLCRRSRRLSQYSQRSNASRR